MPIVSISLDEKTLSGLESIRRELGFAGRSETIRSAVRAMIAENRKLGKLSGRVKAVLLVTHSEKAEGHATGFKHEFEDVVSTQIHGNLSEGKCLEIFILSGSASRVSEMVKAAQANRRIEQVRLVLP